MLQENTNLQFEDIADGFFVAVDDTHRFGTDAFLLADFCLAKEKDIALDIGTGCGIIPILWARSGKCASITGVELQTEAARLAKASVERSICAEKITIIHDNIKNYKSFLTPGSLDLIACNPPYKANGGGLTNENPQKTIARHEHSCTFGDICTAAAFSLRWSGRFCVCQRPERLTDILLGMRSHGIEPKRLRMVHQRDGSEPWLVLIEGRRGGKSGVRILPPFWMENPDGKPSAELKNVYGK